MSVAFCVIFQKDVSSYGTLGEDNLLLAKNYEKLDAVATKHGLTTLGSFLSQDPDELAELMDVDPDDADLPQEEWFSAADGVKAVQAIVAFLKGNPKAISKCSDYISELEEIETELQAAAESKVKFHFALVM